MLESRELRIGPALGSPGVRCALVCPASDENPVGVISEDRTVGVGALRRFLPESWLPIKLDVREKPDDSLVFSVIRGWPWMMWVEVRDSFGELVGQFQAGFVRVGDSLLIGPSKGCAHLVITRTTAETFRIYSRVDSTDYAHIEHTPHDCRVEFAEELDGHPFVKMMILAVAVNTYSAPEA